MHNVDVLKKNTKKTGVPFVFDKDKFQQQRAHKKGQMSCWWTVNIYRGNSEGVVCFQETANAPHKRRIRNNAAGKRCEKQAALA